ncbi:MAG: hypothetical protein Q8R92_21110 [Deltaproteobacteria bacterium]|nr:hypothetical protein [Deltaproteobacteria bacterium]
MARDIVTQALLERDRRGERSLQFATVEAEPTAIRPLAHTTYVDVTCQPSGLRLTAQVATSVVGGIGPLRPLEPVLVAVPRGELLGESWIIARLNTVVSPAPLPTAPTNVLIESLQGVLELRSLPGVWLNGPGAAAARMGDTVTLSADWLAWLLGLATAAQYPTTPPPTPIGAIATGSALTQIG